MGQFSWLDCETGEQILDDVERKTYVLVPAEYGGGHIEEDCYDGYGNFGGNDVYDLVALWNRDFIPQILKYREEGAWRAFIGDEEAKYLQQFSEHKIPKKEDGRTYELRLIGIAMACYNEDNERLPYPIKITHDKTAVYEDCEPSKSDPNQGWKMYEYEDDEEEDDESLWKYATLEDDDDEWKNHLLWNLLKEHAGHRVEIAVYGDPNDPANITLEDMDTNEVILDAEIYTICAREDV